METALLAAANGTSEIGGRRGERREDATTAEPKAEEARRV